MKVDSNEKIPPPSSLHDQADGASAQFQRWEVRGVDVLTSLSRAYDLWYFFTKALPLPDLLNLRLVNRSICNAIESDVIQEASKRYTVSFSGLSNTHKGISCSQLSDMLHQYDQVEILASKETVDVKNLNVINIEGVKITDDFQLYAGQLESGQRFILTKGSFDFIESIRNRQKPDTFYLYVGNSYTKIVDLIKNHRSDNLPCMIERLLGNQSKKYY